MGPSDAMLAMRKINAFTMLMDTMMKVLFWIVNTNIPVASYIDDHELRTEDGFIFKSTIVVNRNSGKL